MDARKFLVGWGGLMLFAALGLWIAGGNPFASPGALLLRPTTVPPPGETVLLLDYDLGSIDLAGVSGDGATVASGEPVFVAFDRIGERAVPLSVTRAEPRGAFLRGVVRGRSGGRLLVHYGVENLVVPEALRAEYDALPRPFDVRVRVDADGRARAVGLVAGERVVDLGF